MKSQSLKLFTIAFVLGAAAIFGAGSVNAQSKMTFETPFDFHVGKDKFSAGKYEFQKLSAGKYLLKGTDTKDSKIVLFDMSMSNDNSQADQRILFNRYNDTYFLRGIFEKEGADGRMTVESNYEKQIRKGAVAREDQLAGEKGKPTKVSVNLLKK
jgi:hypothetical protein